MKATTPDLVEARREWLSSRPLLAGRRLFEALATSARVPWARSVVAHACRVAPEIPVISAALEVAADRARWAQARAAFGDIRVHTNQHMTSVHDKSVRVCQLQLGEVLAKVTYNASGGSAPYDHHAGYRLAAHLATLVKKIRKRWFTEASWSVLAAPFVGAEQSPDQVQPTPGLVWSNALFDVSEELLATLRHYRSSRPNARPIEWFYDVFLLDPGRGAPVYLASDGRLLWEDDGWSIAPTRAEAYMSILSGVSKTGINSLRKLLPARPVDAVACTACSSTGRPLRSQAIPSDSSTLSGVLCHMCAGLRWTHPSLDLT